MSLVAAVANLAFWWWVAMRGEKRFRVWCERRYNVTITYRGRSGWHVDGEGSWWRRGAISWLQLAWFMGAFVVWGIAVLLVVLVQQKLF